MLRRKRISWAQTKTSYTLNKTNLSSFTLFSSGSFIIDMKTLRMLIVVIKKNDQNQLGRKGLILSYSLSPIIQGSQGRKLEAGAEALTGRLLVTGCFLMACSACSLTQPGTTYRGWHCSQWARPPVPITNWENAPQACPQSSWWEHFLHWVSLFPIYFASRRHRTSQQSPTSIIFDTVIKSIKRYQALKRCTINSRPNTIKIMCMVSDGWFSG